MIILFREPLAHATSLLEKHKQYSILQKEDPFVLEYMNWLGHYEFGLNHKPFNFENSSTNEHTIDSLDYWIQNWINYYRYALKQGHENTLFVQYEAYCESPNETLKRILYKTSIKSDQGRIDSFQNKRKVEYSYSQDLYQISTNIYEKLSSKSIS